MKNTHKYNPYKFQLEMPSKIIGLRYFAKHETFVDEKAKPASAGKKAKDTEKGRDKLSEKEKQEKARIELENRLKARTKELLDGDFFQKFKKMFPEKAKNMADGLKQMFGPSGKLAKYAETPRALKVPTELYFYNTVSEMIKEAQALVNRQEELDRFFGKKDDAGDFRDMIQQEIDEQVSKADLSTTDFRPVAFNFGDLILAQSKSAIVALRKTVMKDGTAFKEKADGSLELKLNHKEVKTFIETIFKRIKEKIQQEKDANNILSNKGNDPSIRETFYLEGSAGKESADSQRGTEAYVRKQIRPQLMSGQDVNIQITGNTSAEGNPFFNKELQKKRAFAKKRAILNAIDKVMTEKMGRNWKSKVKGKVKFTILTKSVEPSLKQSDVSAGLQDNLAALNQSSHAIIKWFKGLSIFGDLVKKLKAPRLSMKEVIKTANAIPNPEKRLFAIIAILQRGLADPKVVIREYNIYTDLKIKKSEQAADDFLNKKAKYLKNNRALMNYLHRYVGKARSSEVKVLTKEAPVPMVDETRKYAKMLTTMRDVFKKEGYRVVTDTKNGVIEGMNVSYKKEKTVYFTFNLDARPISVAATVWKKIGMYNVPVGSPQRLTGEPKSAAKKMKDLVDKECGQPPQKIAEGPTSYPFEG